MGSRFLTRGIDDSGNVANSVESETILIENEERDFNYIRNVRYTKVRHFTPCVAFGKNIEIVQDNIITSSIAWIGSEFLGAAWNQFWPT